MPCRPFDGSQELRYDIRRIRLESLLIVRAGNSVIIQSHHAILVAARGAPM